MEVTKYAKARKNIWNGDLLAFRRKSGISWLGRGPYSHIAMAVWRDDDCGGTLSLAEFREWSGSGVRTLSQAVRDDPGVIDVFRPNFPDAKHYAIAERAATIMYRQAGKQYDYPGIFRLFLLHLPFASYVANRLFGFGADMADTKPAAWQSWKFCSFAFDWSYCRAIAELDYETDWRPVTDLGSKWIEPSDLTRSGSFTRVYQGLVL